LRVASPRLVAADLAGRAIDAGNGIAGRLPRGGAPLRPKTFEELSYVPETSALYDWMTGRDHLEFTRRAFRRYDAGRARELLELFGLDPMRKAGKLSKGQQSALALTMAFSIRPRMLVLDEPFVLGDVISVGTDTGTVEKIGLKTTRLRSLSGEQLIFANADLLKSRIRNLKRMYQRRVVFSLSIAYGTPREKLAASDGWTWRRGIGGATARPSRIATAEAVLTGTAGCPEIRREKGSYGSGRGNGNRLNIG